MRAGESDERARFAALFAANYALVHAFAERRVGRDLADEVTADTFLVAWRRLEVVPVEPIPWLYGVARNVVFRQYRANAHQNRAREMLERERPPDGSPEDSEREDVWQAWEQLSEADREVLALIAWEDLCVRDAARVLDVPVRVFSVRLHRARRRFESHLRQPVSVAVSSTPEAT
jgi:RNA polymerase sigma-70 factor (ECF subfamily)